MNKSASLICALITTFIWGTAFIAQDTGMDNIGPLTFNSARFFVGFLFMLPVALIIERKKIIPEINSTKNFFLNIICLWEYLYFWVLRFNKLLYNTPILLMQHFLQFSTSQLFQYCYFFFIKSKFTGVSGPQ